MEKIDGFGIGQFVNDGAKPDITGEERNFVSAVEELEKYEDKSHSKANCQIDEQLWFVAIKNIKPGEELYCHYGFQFWVSKYLQQATTPLSRLLIYSLFNQDTQPFNLGKLDSYSYFSFIRDKFNKSEVNRACVYCNLIPESPFECKIFSQLKA